MSLAIFATSTVLALYGPICLVNDYSDDTFKLSQTCFSIFHPSKVGNHSWQRFVFYELLYPQQVADCGQADNERLRIEAPCCHIFSPNLQGGISLGNWTLINVFYDFVLQNSSVVLFSNTLHIFMTSSTCFMVSSFSSFVFWHSSPFWRPSGTCISWTSPHEIAV